MAKHQFVLISGGEARFTTVRRCVLCGRLQQRSQRQSWGRVVGHAWWPLIGRCPGFRMREFDRQKEELKRDHTAARP